MMHLRISGLRVVCLAAAAILFTGCGPDSVIRYTSQKVIHTGFYQLRATHHMFPNPGGMGGGIAYLEGKWLVVSGDGSFRLFDRSETGDDFRVWKLPYHAPMNRNRFAATVVLQGKNQKRELQRFRAMDVVLHQSGRNLQIWVSHHWWDEKESCVTLRVSTAVIDADAFLNSKPIGLNWTTEYEAMPCLELSDGKFSGHESGGKLVLSGNPPDTLYLTVGDLGFNGIPLPSLVQDPEASWGKVIKMDLQVRAASVFTTGHRNPQGLFLDDLGRMWLTEHGPRGGDELNLLKQGENYGWPLVSYGTSYQTYDPWPLSRNPGRHEGFREPVYAWVPSIGVSDLIRLQGDRFPLWKGDIVVASLNGRSLFRIHAREGRAIVVEPIRMDKRIRDIAEGPAGEIVLWSDNHRLIFIEPVLDPEWPK